MQIAVDRMDGFFDQMLADRVVDSDPRDHDTRAHLERDFGHTAVECALDMSTAEEVAASRRQAAFLGSLGKLADPVFSQELVKEVFTSTGGYTREPDEKLARTMREYGQWAGSVRHLEDLAALTICTKFDWPYDRRCVDRVLEFLKSLFQELHPAPRQRLIDEVVASIARPARMAAGA